MQAPQRRRDDSDPRFGAIATQPTPLPPELKTTVILPYFPWFSAFPAYQFWTFIGEPFVCAFIAKLRNFIWTEVGKYLLGRGISVPNIALGLFVVDALVTAFAVMLQCARFLLIERIFCFEDIPV